ncbi:hypothetical protein ACLOJK_002419 [Asimina triloba]
MATAPKAGDGLQTWVAMGFCYVSAQKDKVAIAVLSTIFHIPPKLAVDHCATAIWDDCGKMDGRVI